MPMETKTRELSTLLRKLRTSYTARRIIEILTLSISASLLVDFISYSSALILEKSFHIPFLSIAVMGVLLFRETGQLKQRGFSLYLDKTFHLKDRLYSFYFFTNKLPHILPEIVEAQAAECLLGIDFLSIRKALKPRIPPLLFLVAPLFLLQLYIFLNAGYIPFGGLSKTVVRLTTNAGQALNMKTANQPDVGDSEDSFKGKGDIQNSASSKEESTDKPEKPKQDNIEKVEETSSQKISKKMAGGSADASDNDAKINVKVSSNPDDKIESNPVSKDISSPIEANLAESPDFHPEHFKDAAHLLSLFPQDMDGEIQIDPLLTDIAGTTLKDYPVRHRQHIFLYYEELHKWQEKLEIRLRKN